MQMRAAMPPEWAKYLASRLTFSPMRFFLVCFAIYWSLGQVDGPLTHAPLPLAAVLGLGLTRLPRGLSYGLMAVVFVLVTWNGVFVDALQSHDAESDRDDAAEIAADALLQRDNPWTRHTQLGTNPITTGPSSVLLAAVSVAAFGRINELSFGFWLVLACFCLVGDVRSQNESFIDLMLLATLGYFSLQHTRYWSLEELSYATLLFPLAWLSFQRGHVMWTGAVLSLAILSRASYVFSCAGFMLWLRNEPRLRRQWIRLAAGGLVTLTLTALAFLTLLGPRFTDASPMGIALAKSTHSWPRSNWIFACLDVTASALPSWLRNPWKLVLCGAIMWTTARGLRRVGVRHPLWHVAIGNLIAFTIGTWAGRISMDYVGPLVVSGFLAVAFSQRSALLPGDAPLAPETSQQPRTVT
jgi:hypothetical protein